MLGAWPEPFGLVAIESMATGTPVIARRAGALPEIIEHGRTGFLVDDLQEAVLAVERGGRPGPTAWSARPPWHGSRSSGCWTTTSVSTGSLAAAARRRRGSQSEPVTAIVGDRGTARTEARTGAIGTPDRRGARRRRVGCRRR